MKISADRARRLVYEQYDPDEELTFECIRNTGTSRWTSFHELIVIAPGNRYWAASYEEGLTENQDILAFEDDSEVEFREVKKVPVTTYSYEPL